METPQAVFPHKPAKAWNAHSEASKLHASHETVFQSLPQNSYKLNLLYDYDCFIIKDISRFTNTLIPNSNLYLETFLKLWLKVHASIAGEFATEGFFGLFGAG